MFVLTTEKYFRFVITMVMAITFLPLANYRLPAYIGSPHAWALLWGLSLLFFKPKIFTQKLMLLIALYGFFLLLMLNVFWLGMDDGNVTLLWREFYDISVGISIISYFNITRDYIGFAKIVKYTVIFITITAIMTVITSIIFPMYAREMFQESSAGMESQKLIYTFGAGTYGTAIAFMAIIPLLIYYFKNNTFIQQKKWAVVVMIFLIGLALFRMQIFTNIMIAGLFAFIALVSEKNRKRTYIILGILAIIVVLIPKEEYAHMLYRLSNMFINMEEVSFKLNEFAIYFQYGVNIQNNTIIHRADRFPILLYAFSESPIFGCFFFNYWGFGYLAECFHLYWMNKLTITGIVGFLFFVSILFTFIREETKKLDDGFRFYFILSVFSILVYGLFKNITDRECWYLFFVILPGMYYLPLLKK